MTTMAVGRAACAPARARTAADRNAPSSTEKSRLSQNGECDIATAPTIVLTGETVPALAPGEFGPDGLFVRVCGDAPPRGARAHDAQPAAGVRALPGPAQHRQTVGGGIAHRDVDVAGGARE